MEVRAGKGCQNMIFLTFGTGLGSGLILNGQLYREVPVWLGKQDTYVWKMRDQKDMEKQVAWKVSALEEVSAACRIFWHRRKRKGAGRTG